MKTEQNYGDKKRDQLISTDITQSYARETPRYWWAIWPALRHECIATAISTYTSTNYIQNGHECQEHDRQYDILLYHPMR
jgi:hypothetical protein